MTTASGKALINYLRTMQNNDPALFNRVSTTIAARTRGRLSGLGQNEVWSDITVTPETHGGGSSFWDTLSNIGSEVVTGVWGVTKSAVNTYAQNEKAKEQWKQQAELEMQKQEQELAKQRAAAQSATMQLQLQREQIAIQQDLQNFKTEQITKVATWAAILFGAYFAAKALGVFR
jgi:hypothetical protein